MDTISTSEVMFDKGFIISENGIEAKSKTHTIFNTPWAWIMTTNENFNSRISDARKESKFDYRDGFTTLEDVIDYINIWF